MKFYRVIYKSVYLEEGESIVEVTTFLSKDLAISYLKRQIEFIKQDVEDLEDYCVEENEESYERYLDGRIAEDDVAIWLEEAEFYDEKELEIEQEEKEKRQEENNKDNDYEMV